MSRLPIYQNPKTDSHWRAVLNAIQVDLNLDAIDIATLQAVVGDSGTAAGAVTAGQALYTSGAGTAALAKADALASSRIAGFATQTTTGAGVVSFQSAGIIDKTGIVAGSRYYLSAVTAGALVTAVDAVAGQYLVLAGWGVDTDRLLFVPSSPILL